MVYEKTFFWNFKHTDFHNEFAFSPLSHTIVFQRSVCPQNPSLAAKQLTPVRRVLQLNNTFSDFSLVNIPSTPSASASASTAVPPLALLHANSPSLSAALQPLPASPAVLPPSTASPKCSLNNSHHRIVHYSSSSSSDSEDEQEEEMQNTQVANKLFLQNQSNCLQNGETSSSPDLFLPVADLHINDNHNDIGFDYGWIDNSTVLTLILQIFLMTIPWIWMAVLPLSTLPFHRQAVVHPQGLQTELARRRVSYCYYLKIQNDFLLIVKK